MADSDRRVVRAPLRSATTRRKKELDKARLATRVTLKNQKGRWDRLKTVLKMKDSEVADILFDTFPVYRARNFLAAIEEAQRFATEDKQQRAHCLPQGIQQKREKLDNCARAATETL
ncbi:hypothetical protein LSAT2_026362 [Lamellibrachia satsuma]|nr:hypothetical protein LSAT2_026362 [Lamellibrachia satsuma]